ncbi:MAG TPA: rRNA maturation RNase YbeY [Gemmatimonadaceae bacterium]|jgi:probable rRNA maturation factor|nr:rRNA maturation RNase YbeY [Gemmatimonadaceae bacterium]
MTRVVHVSSSAGRLPLSRRRIAGLADRVLRAERVRSAEVSIAFVTEPAIARLNARHLGRRGPTDVIAFPFARIDGGPLVGDVYIAPAVARSNARRNGVPVRQELARLVVHGTLHVLGHDHPAVGRERSAMWRRQEHLLARAREAWT